MQTLSEGLGLKLLNTRRRRVLVVWFLTIGVALVMALAPMKGLATTMYSYIDEQGTPVITDNFNTIPERYRAKVKTTEQIPTASPTASMAGTIHERLSNIGRQVRDMASGSVPKISGLSSSQSEILTYAGLAAVVLIVAMSLSKGQSVRLLALWCLIMLGLATPVLMYVSKDGPMDAMKSKAAQVEKQHQDRIQQIP
jgi:hypothetical protein